MSFRLPFDENVLSEYFGSTLVLSKNNAYSSLFETIKEIVLVKDGSAKGIDSWEIHDGSLRLCEDGGLRYEFCSTETKNGCVYAVGRDVLESSANGVSRVILHRKSFIASTDVGVCASSHADYEKATLPRLFKSLKRNGFNMNNVFAVVGGDFKTAGETNIDPEYKVKVIRQKPNYMGFTAFSELSDFGALHYWLLLHDTCDVTDGFTEKIKTLDIGLNPDIILFSHPKEKSEIGIYSSDFIKKCGLPTQGVKGHEFLDVLISRAKIVVALNATTKKETERDVYGMGNKRETILFHSLGIRKYKGKVVVNGKP